MQDLPERPAGQRPRGQKSACAIGPLPRESAEGFEMLALAKMTSPARLPVRIWRRSSGSSPLALFVWRIVLVGVIVIALLGLGTAGLALSEHVGAWYAFR